MKRTYPLSLKLLLSHSAIIITFLAVLIIGRFIIQKQFEEYLISRHESQIDSMEELILNYLEEDDGLNKTARSVLMQQYGTRGYNFTLYDEDDQLIMDTETEVLELFEGPNGNNILDGDRRPEKEPGFGEPVLKEPGLGEPYIERLNPENPEAPDNKLSLIKKEDERYLYSDDIVIGRLVVNYTLVNEMQPEDGIYFEEFLSLYQWMMIIVFIIAIILSLINSRSITRPIQYVIKTAESMGIGDLGKRVEISTKTTELEELKQAINSLADILEEEDMLRKQMTSDMAHEIRTPVNNVQNIMEAMIDGIWEPTNENLERCYHEVLRINRLVDELKSISTLEENNLIANDEIFDVVKQSQQVMNTFLSQAEKKGVSIDFSSPEFLNVNMDRSKFDQIVSNLISNSLRYCYEETVIHVSVEKHFKSEVKILVEDKGIGIKEEHLNRIFERFYRTDRSRTKETGGLGLGLTITKNIVGKYKGTIEVTSEVNVGTKFELILPIIVN